MFRKKALPFFGIMALTCASACAAPTGKNEEPPAEYLTWLNELKKEMAEKGISQKTLDVAFAENYYRPEHDVVKKDRSQAEFVLTSTDYLNRLVNRKKVEQGRQKYKELYPEYQKMSQQYGVPFQYIVAFWGMETNYGQTFGNHNVIEALTVLSYDRRRPAFFRNELYNALKIIDQGNIDVKGMEGSWAGAMGHFQFMPTTFNAYAVDYDKDGKIDIWNSYKDAAASAANYLSKMGWKANEPWGAEIILPWNFDYTQSGRSSTKKISEWNRMGVRTADGKKLPFDENSAASVIVPEGRRGRAYIVLDNFKIIMKWNRSENYALAVAGLADYVKNGNDWQPRQKVIPPLKSEDISALQDFVSQQGWVDLKSDGQLGGKTREAVKMLQKKAGRPQDGYPDYALLQKIKNYNPQNGFSVLPQPRRPDISRKYNSQD